MAVSFGIVYPLWLGDRNEALLDRAIGEIGINHLSIPAITGEARAFRPFGEVDAAYFHSEGGWQFPPDSKRYVSSGIKPKAAKWCGQRDVMQKVADLAIQRGVQLALRLDPLASPSVRHADATLFERNAWGMTDDSAPACLSSPQIRELIHESVADAARYAAAEVVFDSLGLDRGLPKLHSMHAWWTLTELTRICFCPACRQIAHADGIDADAAARSVVVHGRRALEAASKQQDFDAESALADDELLSAYRECRWDSARRWMTHLTETHKPIAFLRGVTDFGSHSEEDFSGLHTDGWRRLMDVNWSGWGEDELGEFADQAAAFGITDVQLDLWPQFLEGPDALLRVVHGLVDAGVTRFDFANLHELPDDSIDGVRKAVRYARRG